MLEVLVKGTYLKELRLLSNIIEAIDELLKLDIHMGLKNTPNSICLMFEKYGGLDALEEAQKHPNYDIYQKAQ